VVSNKLDLSLHFLLLNKGTQLSITVSPIAETISEILLTNSITQSKYAAFKLNPTGIKQAVKAFQELNKLKNKPSEPQVIVIADRIDAQLTITIDDLILEAKAEIISAYGGHPITLDLLAEKMKALKISYGISKKMLHLLIQKSKNSPPGTTYQTVIAKGKLAVNGADTKFERLVEIPSERIMRPREMENGQVDMRDLGELVTVSPNTPLMRKTPYQEGTPGMTITGKPINQYIGKDIPFNVGSHTEIDQNDDNILIATIAGIPQKIENGIRVDDALIIKDVDVASGNINYKGDVIVSGNISEGMKINATGNITVAGFIESAQIECDGDLFVAHGILGHKIDTTDSLYSCKINCKGSVTATYSQYTHMNIDKDLNIKTQLLHCLVHCKGHISVQNESGNKGVILGGHLFAQQGISTVIIGSTAGTNTKLDLTGIYPELSETKKQIELDIPNQQEKLSSIFETLQMIGAAPSTKKREEINHRLTLLQKKVEDTLLILEKKQEENLVALEGYFNLSKVITSNKLYSQTSILIADKMINTLQNTGPSCVCMQNDTLVVTPYQK
jgi:uncharacterized protein (DUF342 family)